MNDNELACVKSFVIGHKDLGRVEFLVPVDLRGLQLATLFRFEPEEFSFGSSLERLDPAKLPQITNVPVRLCLRLSREELQDKNTLDERNEVQAYLRELFQTEDMNVEAYDFENEELRLQLRSLAAVYASEEKTSQ